ncbi:discoidin domain-containing protein [Microbulbifer thermotolerans]|uniref:discoidin domain-containing protein n=1 Tax=Microbulbifer thermotolerans TaxID=252514 RepID=UPI0009EE1C93|nr:discoidin domain-containing protein [Microbulbifer thermotolerans]MCX2781327.1 discoidin domain-containing protein [Microbulbifer thermotolerans]MCX2803763.1 discoidin domain-containing protein [Microbulbifer thermotolerans]
MIIKNKILAGCLALTASIAYSAAYSAESAIGIATAFDDGSGHANYPATNVIDGDTSFASRWAGYGSPVNLTVQLAQPTLVSEVGIAWGRGDQRIYKFEIYVRPDTSGSWTRVFNGESSGTTAEIDFIDIADIEVQEVRIKTHSNSASTNWTDITEVKLLGQAPDNLEPESEICFGSYDLPDCVAAMSAKGGGTVNLEAKTYYLTESLILKDNVNIVGQGYDTVITWPDSIADSINEPLLYATAVNNVELRDFKLRCHINQDPNSYDLRNDHMGLFLEGSGDPSQGEATSNNNLYMERIEAMYCSNGMHIKGATGVTAIDLKLHNNGNTETDLFHNIYFRRVADLVMIQTDDNVGGYYDSPRGHGIRASHIKNAYLENLKVTNNADHGLHFTDGIYDTRFVNLNVYGNCANPSGTCNQIKCYGSPCDIDYDAEVETNIIK